MTRLYCPYDLFTGQSLTLNEGQTHYLRHVLRAEVGHQVSVFNERDGEWSAILDALSKNKATLRLKAQLRLATVGPHISLLFAPIKHDPLTFLIEKATELGVCHFHPVMTERCNVSRVNHDRLASNAKEAAQQCERFDIPTIYPLITLSAALTAWNLDVPLFVCQERGEVPTITTILQSLPSYAPVGFLIGPEGGFSSQEIAYCKSFSFTQFINLGPRVLRAETAALAAVTCYQAMVGDFK